MLVAELQELEEVKNLLSKGQQVGVLTFGEIASAVSEVDVDENEIEELYGHLESPAFAYQAAKTFGEIYSVCGRCGAELTDDTSREHKFGPICWDLMAPFREAFETA